MRRSGFAILALVVFGNLVLWAALHRSQEMADWSDPIAGVSFSPYQDGQNPLEGRHPAVQELDADLGFLAGKVRSVRTYSSLDGLEAVPRLAEKHGLRVTAGAWLDGRKARNELEIQSLIKNVRESHSIDRLIAGNEAVLRGDLTVKELIAYIERVRKASKLPVSTAEPWHVWIKHPELARSVDYIAVHLLPYWEGVPHEQSLDYVQERYRQLQAAFPGKPILIAEVGWPSGGNRVGGAQPTRMSEAAFIRQFLNIAKREHFDYFIMEAFDQPWKVAIEGKAGPHWGLFSVERQAKFSMSGPLAENPLWKYEAALAVVLALVPMVWFLRTWRHFQARGRLFFAALIQGVGSLFAVSLFLPATEVFTPWGYGMWVFLLLAQVALYAVVLINGFELTELTWAQSLRRQYGPLQPAHGRTLPKVSLHLAICNEPSGLVIQTLDSLAALDYPDFEVLVIDNNTSDARLWRPVEEHCARLGARFRFFSLGKWQGFKAGALNFALRQTDPAAEVIGVVDSDYVVRPDWLRSLVPYFDKRTVGFVQAPQDHREWRDDRFKTLCNWEYAGFFHIGMVHRHERDAIIQHGTMTLVRKSALHELGGWGEWCICEDAELGLRLYKAGYESVYVNENFGQGLTPHSYAGFKGQRFRWVYGAVQILKHHWRELMPWSHNRLSPGQRYHFITGWLPWFTDSLQSLFTLVALFWTLGLILMPDAFEFPPLSFVVPVFGMIAFKLLHGLWLYTRRVPCSFGERIGAAVAGMSLTHVIARAVFQGFRTSDQPFLRTPKAEDKPAIVRALLVVREEFLILAALWSCVFGVLITFGGGHLEARWWLALLVVQSLPYASAVYCALLNVFPAPQRFGFSRHLQPLSRFLVRAKPPVAASISSRSAAATKNA